MSNPYKFPDIKKTTGSQINFVFPLNKDDPTLPPWVVSSVTGTAHLDGPDGVDTTSQIIGPFPASSSNNAVVRLQGGDDGSRHFLDFFATMTSSEIVNFQGYLTVEDVS